MVRTTDRHTSRLYRYGYRDGVTAAQFRSLNDNTIVRAVVGILSSAAPGPSLLDGKMTEKEALFREIAAIRATINRDWADLTSLSLGHDERTALRAHIEKCVQDLKELAERLDELGGGSE
jgi:hypothetical protein